MTGRRAASGLLCLLGTACGYHTASYKSQLPADLHSLAVPAFSNQTQTYKIEQMLTSAVVEELRTRTRYHLTADPGTADATLRGRVLSASSTPLTYDSKTGRATTVLVIVAMRVSLTDAKGKVLYQNPSYLFREQYQISEDLSSFFEENSSAYARVAAEFARSLVSNLLEAF